MQTCFRCGNPVIPDLTKRGQRRSKFCSQTCQNKQGVTDYRRRVKLKGLALLGGKCTRCGYNRCPWALQFHHKDPSEKDFQIAAKSRQAWDKVKAEVLKCELLCANCHAEEHAQKYTWGVAQQVQHLAVNQAFTDSNSVAPAIHKL
jgi:hypothetical protein